MNAHPCRLELVRLALLLLVVQGPAGAQSLPPAPVPSPATAREDEPVLLSPFEVSSETDRGYQPTAVLQGGRGRIELADIAGQVTVFTKELLEDIGATSLDEAFLFSATTQTYYDNVDGDGDNRPGSRNTVAAAANAGDDSMNSRGLGALDRTRNFFRTSIDPDAYNVERLNLVSGANAVQFGLGGAAGTAESTTARANLSRNRQRLQLRMDSYGSERGVIDINQVVWRNKLAVRAIGLRENKEYFIRPGFEENRRGFATASYRPFTGTTVRVEGEYVYRRDNRPSTPLARDAGYLSWLETPIEYANRAATAPTAGRPPAPNYRLHDGTGRNYAFSTKQNLFVWPHNSVPEFTGLQDVRNTVWVAGAGVTQAAQTQSFRVPGYPWDVNPMGMSRYNRRRTRNLIATVEQRLGEKTYLEFGYAWEAYRNHTAQLMAHNAYDIMVDINRYLPDGITANPMYGRPFVESNNATGQGSWADWNMKQYRAVLAHELDLTRASGWTRHLGRHRLALFASHDDTTEYFLGNNRFLIIGNPSFLPAAAQDNPLHAGRALHMRYYLPPLGSTDDAGAYGVPSPAAYGDIMGIMNFTTASGEPFQVTQYMNPVGFVGTTPRLGHLQRLSGAASTSSTFFQNHLVANIGVRHDRVRNSDFSDFRPIRSENPPTAANPNGTGLLAYDDFRLHPPPDNWTPYRQATRANYGLVLRPPRVPWLSVGYDYSRNATLNQIAVVRDVNGSEVEPAYGESHEYSVRLRLLADKLYLKVNYFNALNRNIALADSGLRRNLIDFEQQLYRNDPGYPINPLFREELNAVPGDFRLPGDRNSKGIEIDLTYNPAPNWRFFWNAGRTDTEVDDISTEPWWNYLDAKLATWMAVRGNWSTAPYAEGLTVENAWNTLIADPLDNIRASLGNPGGNSQTWRSNLVATHSFTSGRLKGAGASINLRYRGPRVIGFPTYVNERGQQRVNRDAPYKSDDYILTGLMASYRFRGWQDTSWRVQLNVNNVFNSHRLYLTRVFDDGAARNFGRQPGREFLLSVQVEH